jgi:hypothetical protein
MHAEQSVLKTLFLQAPSFDGFDGGAGRLREGVEFFRFLRAQQA